RGAPIGLPRCADISGCPPEVPYGSCPLPRLSLTPRTEAVDDGPPSGILGVMELTIGLSSVLALGIAPIDLDVICPPRGKGRHVFELVVLGARHGLATGAGPSVGV